MNTKQCIVNIQTNFFDFYFDETFSMYKLLIIRFGTCRDQIQTDLNSSFAQLTLHGWMENTLSLEKLQGEWKLYEKSNVREVPMELLIPKSKSRIPDFYIN